MAARQESPWSCDRSRRGRATGVAVVVRQESRGRRSPSLAPFTGSSSPFHLKYLIHCIAIQERGSEVIHGDEKQPDQASVTGAWGRCSGGAGRGCLPVLALHHPDRAVGLLHPARSLAGGRAGDDHPQRGVDAECARRCAGVAGALPVAGSGRATRGRQRYHRRPNRRERRAAANRRLGPRHAGHPARLRHRLPR